MCYQYYYWCKYLNTQVYCNGVCAGCIRNTDNFQNNYIQQFNYECPDCHGKFNNPNNKLVEEVNYGLTHCPKTSYYTYVCPFCGRIMKGL